MTSLKTAVSAFALLLASAGVAAAFPATATNNVNVRSGPGTNFGVVSQLSAGDTVEVTATQGNWYQIDGSGWASANYLSTDQAAAVEQPYYEDPGYGGADIAFYYGSDPYYWDDGGYYWYWRGGRRHRVDWDWFRDRDRNDFRWTDNRHRRDFDNRWRGDRFTGNGSQRIVRSGSREFGGDRQIIRRGSIEGPSVDGRGRFRGEGEVVRRDGQIVRGDGQIVRGDGQVVRRDGQIARGDGQVVRRDGQIARGDGQVVRGDGQIVRRDGQIVRGDGQVVRRDGQIVRGDGQVVRGEGRLQTGRASASGPAPVVRSGGMREGGGGGSGSFNAGRGGGGGGGGAPVFRSGGGQGRGGGGY